MVTITSTAEVMLNIDFVTIFNFETPILNCDYHCLNPILAFGFGLVLGGKGAPHSGQKPFFRIASLCF
jgi:hypothetical protein